MLAKTSPSRSSRRPASSCRSASRSSSTAPSASSSRSCKTTAPVNAADIDRIFAILEESKSATALREAKAALSAAIRTRTRHAIDAYVGEWEASLELMRIPGLVSRVRKAVAHPETLVNVPAGMTLCEMIDAHAKKTRRPR